MGIGLPKYVCTDLCFQMKQSYAVMIAGVASALQAHASSNLLKYSTDISLLESVSVTQPELVFLGKRLENTNLI